MHSRQDGARGFRCPTPIYLRLLLKPQSALHPAQVPQMSHWELPKAHLIKSGFTIPILQTLHISILARPTVTAYAPEWGNTWLNSDSAWRGGWFFGASRHYEYCGDLRRRDAGCFYYAGQWNLNYAWAGAWSKYRGHRYSL